ncbi:MAG: UbiA family prenyltransferase [Planctomycetes bacterium]|nr:UbiA family prenyltransferase [Planctomycetota bacterium]
MGIETVKQVSKTEAWLGMLRISNAPTIVSNIFVGTAIAIQSDYFVWNASYDLFLAICILAIYFAGMILNDAFDAKYDKKLRPERPIPSGIVTRAAAWILGIAILVAVSIFGYGHGSAQGLLLLVVAVLLYTFFHRWLIPAILFMAACRGLVYFIVANPVQGADLTLLITFSIALACYTAVLTCIGSFENKKDTKYAWVTWLLMLPPTYVVLNNLTTSWIACIPLAGMAYWIWLAWVNFQSGNKISGMHKILSGFCLLDCVLAVSLGQYGIAVLCLACFITTVAFHRKILGT